MSVVKEEVKKRIPVKRVDIVSLRLVRDKSFLYKNRAIRSPADDYDLFKQFLGELDREYFVVMSLDVKNQPTSINVCHIQCSIHHCLSQSSFRTGRTKQEEIGVTKQLIQAGDLMSIELLDHLIIGDNTFISPKEKGYM